MGNFQISSIFRPCKKLRLENAHSACLSVTFDSFQADCPLPSLHKPLSFADFEHTGRSILLFLPYWVSGKQHIYVGIDHTSDWIHYHRVCTSRYDQECRKGSFGSQSCTNYMHDQDQVRADQIDCAAVD